MRHRLTRLACWWLGHPAVPQGRVNHLDVYRCLCGRRWIAAAKLARYGSDEPVMAPFDFIEGRRRRA